MLTYVGEAKVYKASQLYINHVHRIAKSHKTSMSHEFNVSHCENREGCGLYYIPDERRCLLRYSTDMKTFPQHLHGWGTCLCTSK